MSKKKQGKLSKYNVLGLLNEKINSMGYKYSLGSFFKNFFLFSVFIIILGYFHKLDIPLVLFLIFAYFMLLPFSIISQYKYLYEQKRFQELCVYLKQMKINFKAHKKILIALQETLAVFEPEDRIYPYISEAVDKISNGVSFREALNVIEGTYKNSYITKLHAFMILGELEGGDTVYQALENIDYNTWQSDTMIFQTEKYKIQNQNAYYTIFSMLSSLCIVLGILQSAMAAGEGVLINVFVTPSYQIDTFIYILLNLVSYVFIKTMITGKWIREDE